MHYNWGGGSEGRPAYPRQYGARCEYFSQFFVSYASTLQCAGCKHYKYKRYFDTLNAKYIAKYRIG